MHGALILYIKSFLSYTSNYKAEQKPLLPTARGRHPHHYGELILPINYPLCFTYMTGLNDYLELNIGRKQ